MTRNECAVRLTRTMRDIFDTDDLQYADNLAAGDIEGWDSLSHVRFLVAVEREFRFRFTSGEVDGFKNIGQMVDVIVQRGSAA